MPRRISLPIVLDLLAKSEREADALSLAAARRRLGGRSDGAASADVGRVVALEPDAMGVVLHADSEKWDVWMVAGFVRRTRARGEDVRDVPQALARVAADVLVFRGLSEGDPVAFESGGERREGTLIEKHRYGALVLADGGKIMAVGFRKVWPRGAPGAEPS